MCSCHFSFRGFPRSEASTFLLPQSLKTAFDSVMRGYKKLPESWDSWLNDKCPPDPLEFELDRDKERATSSKSKQLDVVITHPAPSYEPTLFPWWSIPAESSAGCEAGLVAQTGCSSLVSQLGAAPWQGSRCISVTSAGYVISCSAPLAQCSEAQRLRHAKLLVALSLAFCPA